VIFSCIFLADQRPPSVERFDLPGFVLSGLGFGLVMYGMSEGPTFGWHTTQVNVKHARAAEDLGECRYCSVVTTVALLEVVDVLIVMCTLVRVLRKARTARARARASFTLPLAYPVMVTDAPELSFFASAFSAARSFAVSLLEEFENFAVSVPGRGDTATWLEVSTKTGSLEKEKVIEPFEAAVPTSVRPEEVRMYTSSPATMLGSVMVIVIGVVATGDAPFVVCHDTAKAATYDWPGGTSDDSEVVTGYTLSVVPAGSAPVGTLSDVEALPLDAMSVDAADDETVVDSGVP
jgi:hypothetical protein